MATTNEAVGAESEERSLLVRAVWYAFVGWWATGLWLSVAWVLNLTIVGMPLGIKMINKTPKVLSLKEPDRRTEVTIDDDGNAEVAAVEQRSLLVRGLYFVAVGWWASGVWISIAYVCSLSIVGIPIAVLMYNKLPAVVSLYRY